MEQPTFSDLEYQGKKRKTRRELFLERVDGLIPWQKLEGRIQPFYPKAGRGHHPCGASRPVGPFKQPSPQCETEGHWTIRKPRTGDLVPLPATQTKFRLSRTLFGVSLAKRVCDK